MKKEFIELIEKRREELINDYMKFKTDIDLEKIKICSDIITADKVEKQSNMTINLVDSMLDITEQLKNKEINIDDLMKNMMG